MEDVGLKAFTDTDVVDRATRAFFQIIEDEKSAEGQKGDHFGKPGANDRVWNALEKLAVLDPDTFVSYYRNDIIALTTTQLAGLTVTQLSALDTTDLQALTTTQIASLSTTQVKGLTATQIGDLGDTQAAVLTATQVGALTTTQLKAIETTDLAELSVTQLANPNRLMIELRPSTGRTIPTSPLPEGAPSTVSEVSAPPRPVRTRTSPEPTGAHQSPGRCLPPDPPEQDRASRRKARSSTRWARPRVFHC